MVDLSSSLKLLAAAVLFYVLALAFYRLFLSPISHIPGPRLAALTYYYQSYYDVFPHNGQFTFHCAKLHEKHGPVIRVGPGEVNVNDVSFYNEMFTTHARKRNKSKLWFWMENLDAFSGRSVFATLDHDHHRLRRSAFAQYFSRGRVLELQPRILGKVELLRDVLLKRAGTGELVNLRNACGALTLEVITEYAFGRPILAIQTDDFAAVYNEIIGLGMPLLTLGRTFPIFVRSMLQMPDWVMARDPKFKASKDLENRVINVTRQAYDEAMDEERNSTADKKRDVTVIREMVHSGVFPSEEKEFHRIRNEAMIFVVAGMETTGRTLAVTLYHILANPNIHERVLKELHTVIPTPTSPTPSVATLQKLPYLTAVVTEGLRIAHGAAGRLSRVAPDEDLIYRSHDSNKSGKKHEYIIPRGTVFSQSPYLLHMDAKVFPAPSEFHPDRFLGTNAAEAQKSIVPFGRGARMCVGMDLAYAEIYLALAVLLTSVRMELAETTVRDVTVVAEHLIGFLPNDSKGIRVKILVKM